MTKPNKFVLLVFVFLIISLHGCVSTSTPIQSTITPESTLTLTPTAIKTATATITPEPLTLEELVKALFTGEIDFPENLSDQEYSEFIEEMNRQRGIKPIYVEVVDAGGNPNVMYYNTQTRQMETLKGTYLDNKELIDQHGFNIYVEIGQNEQGLTTYIHPDTGEEIVVENSGNIDWDWVGNKDNAGEEIDPETLKNDIIDAAFNRVKNAEYLILPVILINQDPAELVAFQGGSFNYHCAEIMIIRNGLGIRMFAGQEGAWNLINEGSSNQEKVATLNNPSNKKKMPVNMAYYIFFENDQEKNWERSIQEFEIVENAYDPDKVFGEIMEGYSAEENIVLRVPVFIKKK